MAVLSVLNGAGLDIVGVSGSHQAGDLYPTFTVKIRPNRPDLHDLTGEGGLFFGEAYDELVITLNHELSYTCVPRETPRQIQGAEVTYQITYIPKAAHVLRFAKYNKHLLFVSAPQWQYQQLIADLDLSRYTVYFKESDVYTATGFTITDIFQIVSDLIEPDTGITIACQLPTFHVPNPTIEYTPDQILIEFLQGLLPSGFTYVWDWKHSDLLLSLAEPATQTLTIPKYALGVDYNPRRADVTYDTVVITGGNYQRHHGVTLGNAGYASSTAGNYANTFREETVIEEQISLPIMGKVYEQQTAVTKTIKLTPENTPFGIVKEVSTTTAGSALVKETITENSYENDDANIYELPRFRQSTTSLSMNVTCYLQGCIQGVANAWYLTSSGSILSFETYQALAPADRPTILLTAYRALTSPYETRIETKTYVTIDQVDKDWYEGMETQNTVEVSRYMTNIEGVWYDCLDEPQAAVSELASHLAQLSTMPVSLQPMTQWIPVEVTSRKVKLQTKREYLWEESKASFDKIIGALAVQPTRTTRIGSQPPSSPTKYRVEPLRAIAGKEPTETSADVVYSTTGMIPTNNPHDFEVWASQLYYMMTRELQSMQVRVDPVYGYLAPVGYRLARGTCVGWNVQHQGNVEAIEMAVI
jgi:hypothetical protein